MRSQWYRKAALVIATTAQGCELGIDFAPNTVTDVPTSLPDGHKVITFKPRLRLAHPSDQRRPLLTKYLLRPVEREERIPDGWTEYVHLEGQLYYCRTESIDGHNISIVTDYPLRPRENHFKMVQIINTLRKALHGHPILEDRDLPWCEICVIVSDNKATQFGYYIANHQDQTLFWLQEVEAWQVGISEYHEVSRTTPAWPGSS